MRKSNEIREWGAKEQGNKRINYNEGEIRERSEGRTGE